MTDADAFLEAIIARPDDDLPRLVFADWLEEQGDPRAEFIRVQCRLARLVEDDPRRGELAAREQVLLKGYEREWAGPVADRCLAWKFRRGFVDEVAVRLTTFLVHADELFAAAPVRQVDIQPGMGRIGTAQVDELAHHPGLRRVTGLQLVYHAVTVDGLQALLASPHLGRLQALDLRFNALGDEGAMIVAACPALAMLTTLNLTSNVIGSAGFEALVTSPHLGELRSLDVSANSVDDRGLYALAGSPHLPRLTTLVLKRNAVTDHGAQALAAWPGLARVRTVDLSDNFVGDAGARALADAAAAGVWIGLAGNYCSEPSLALRLPAPRT